MSLAFDIIESTVFPLGISSGTSVTSNAPDGLQWDCNIGGINFLLYPSDQYPYQRETAKFRRDRVDTERNPGEQSLDSGSWIRSQASWHYGSGLSTAEPLEVSDSEAQFRYKSGGGVDVWTPGKLSLLHATSSYYTSTGTGQLMIGVDTGVLHADGTTLKYVTTSSATTVTWGGSVNAIKSITSDGANYYASNSTGIYKGVLPSSAGSLIWNTGATPLVRFVKSRLMAAVGTSLYELIGTGPALPTALFTHPSANWVWSDIAEGPSAIYVAGYLGDQSQIYKIDVATTATTVTLGQPTVVADMPRGEKVLSLYSYVGTYLVVGTSAGVRVASMSQDGSLTLGPLIVQTVDGVYDAVASGSFLYITVGSQGQAGNRVTAPGLYRLDLGTNLNGDPLQFPSAPDIFYDLLPGQKCNQVTVAAGQVWFTIDGAGGGVFSTIGNYVGAGWVETGRIRLGTVEPKAWQSLRLLMDQTSAGYVTAYAVANADYGAPSTWTKVLRVEPGEPNGEGSLNAVTASVPQSDIYLAFKLEVGVIVTATPVMNGYQVKAIPAPNRTEMIQVPLLCFDREGDSKNVWYGHPGNAWERFKLLKDLERSAATVQWQDFTTGEVAEAYIEQVSFTRTTPPTRQCTGVGGVVQVLMRLV